jgi:hypothetical protein
VGAKITGITQNMALLDVLLALLGPSRVLESLDKPSYLKTIVIIVVSCHRPFLPGTSLEPTVIPTAQASSFTLQYTPYYV